MIEERMDECNPTMPRGPRPEVAGRGSTSCVFIETDAFRRPWWNLDALIYCAISITCATCRSDSRIDTQPVHGDIRDPETVHSAMAECDTLVHFAAESHVDRSIASGRDFITTNIEARMCFWKKPASLGVARFLHVSTDEVYGSTRQGRL